MINSLQISEQMNKKKRGNRLLQQLVMLLSTQEDMLQG